MEKSRGVELLGRCFLTLPAHLENNHAAFLCLVA
jgi:hypothetical protein